MTNSDMCVLEKALFDAAMRLSKEATTAAEVEALAAVACVLLDLHNS